MQLGANMQEFSKLRIVEIGQAPFMKRALPAQVTYFSTWFDGDPRKIEGNGNYVVSLASINKLWRLVHELQTALVVCHPSALSPWSWRWILRALFDRRVLRGSIPFVRAMGPQILRWPISPPLVVLDFEDLPLINRNNFYLLDRCALYFKRELPSDYWRVFLKTGHANLPTPRFRSSARYKARVNKLRPISLGLPSWTIPHTAVDDHKSTDIFFAGNIEGSSSVRREGLAELLALRDRGFEVDVAERRLSLSEFYERCAKARLTWSPEGLGWDCFRHYEAAMCQSVPLINQPTIARYQPLLHNVHAVYYDLKEGGLTRAATAALADKSQLATMGRAARAHVLSHHTVEAMARHIVCTSLHTPHAGGCIP